MYLCVYLTVVGKPRKRGGERRNELKISIIKQLEEI